MIAWLATKFGVSGFVVEIGLGLLLAGGGFWILRQYGNAQWYKGEQKGRENMSSELEKQYLAREKVELSKLADDRKALTSKVSQVDQELVKIGKMQKEAVATLDKKLAENRQQGEVSHVQAATLTGTDVDDGIRLQLAANDAKLKASTH